MTEANSWVPANLRNRGKTKNWNNRNLLSELRIKYVFKRKNIMQRDKQLRKPMQKPMALGPPLALAAVSTSNSHMIFACRVAQFGSSGSYCNHQKSKYILKHLDVCWYIVRCLLFGSALQMHGFSLSSPSDVEISWECMMYESSRYATSSPASMRSISDHPLL